MQTIRSTTIKEIFTAWAQSEAKRFTYPKSLNEFDLFIQHMKNRAPIYGDILSAIPRDCFLIEINKSDLKNITFLRQVDEKGKEEETSNVRKFAKKYTFNHHPDYNVWNFIAVRRPGKSKLVIIDGLHRFADFTRQTAEDALKGYVIETKNKLKEFEF